MDAGDPFWGDLSELDWSGGWQEEWDTATVLASGNYQFLRHLLPKIHGHGRIFIYATEVVFLGR
jgi:hypothetical protein